MVATINTLNKLVIIGVGLIGGSFALAQKKQSAVKQIIGLDRSDTSLKRALELGLIDVAETNMSSALDGADLVLISTPVAQIEVVLTEIYPHLQPQTIITDTGSTKSDVIAAARFALREKVGQFVPAHPIAGREFNGPDAAIADLYRGKKLVITALPENTESIVNAVATIWGRCDATPHYLTPEVHDQIFAAVSHLPHLLAYALVCQIAEHPEADACFHYAASGFRDFTRIAGSSPEMWRDISLANRAALLKELARYQIQLQKMTHALQQAEGDQLLIMFNSAQAARRKWIDSIEQVEPNK